MVSPNNTEELRRLDHFSVTLFLSVSLQYHACMHGGKSRGRYKASFPATERLRWDICQSKRRFDGESSQFVRESASEDGERKLRHENERDDYRSAQLDEHGKDRQVWTVNTQRRKRTETEEEASKGILKGEGVPG